MPGIVRPISKRGRPRLEDDEVDDYHQIVPLEKGKPKPKNRKYDCICGQRRTGIRNIRTHCRKCKKVKRVMRRAAQMAALDQPDAGVDDDVMMDASQPPDDHDLEQHDADMDTEQGDLLELEQEDADMDTEQGDLLDWDAPTDSDGYCR